MHPKQSCKTAFYWPDGSYGPHLGLAKQSCKLVSSNDQGYDEFGLCLCLVSPSNIKPNPTLKHTTESQFTKKDNKKRGCLKPSSQQHSQFRGVHGSGWVGLREFFDLTHHGEPNPSHKSNPTHTGLVGSGRVGLNPWVGQFFLLLLLLNWVKKIYITLATWVDKQNIH